MISRRFAVSHLHPRHRRFLFHAWRRPLAAHRRRGASVRREARCHSRRGPQRARTEPRPDARRAGRHQRADRRASRTRPARVGTARSRMIAEIKKELQHEMGLVPVTLLRDRRSSFVELYSYDNLGKTNYGTAGYLGGGYFITVKHAVVALKDDDDRQSTRKIASIKIVYKGKEIPAKVDRHRRRRRRKSTAATGRSSRRAISICRRCASIRRSRTTSPIRFSGWATTTRRASSSRPATSGSGHRTASSRASPTATPACRAAACSISAAISSASRSAGCRATTASRSSCRFAPRCCASCRPTSRPTRCRPVLSSPSSN